MAKSPLLSFFLPFCSSNVSNSVLSHARMSSIFDPNVFGVIALFLVCRSFVASKCLIFCCCKKQGPEPRFLQKRLISTIEEPDKLAVHPYKDLIFSADAFNHQIQCFRKNGDLVNQWGSVGQTDGQFRLPRCVTLHVAHNLVFVADFNNQRIQVFDFNGLFVRKWGAAEGYFGPLSVAVQPVSELVFVLLDIEPYVSVFSVNGELIAQWGNVGYGDGELQGPSSLAVHPSQDLLFVADTVNHRVQVFRRDGTFLFKFGSKGNQVGQFSNPHCVSTHPTHNLLFVTDDHAVQIFDTNGTFLCKVGDFQCAFNVSANAMNEVYVRDYTAIYIFSLFSNRVRQISR